MNGGDDPAAGNRTIFRPSPLSGLGQAQAQPPAPPVGTDAGAPAPVAAATSPRPTGPRLGDEGFPVPATPREARAPLVTEAGPLLALVASVRSGRARMGMADLHREAQSALAAYDRAIAPLYPEDTRRLGTAMLAATVDDIAMNLPNIDGSAPWQGPSLAGEFANGWDEERIWSGLDLALKEPDDNPDVIELAHACLAAGYQGKFRTADNGRAQLNELTTRVYAAIDHIKALSQRFVSPQWVGYDAPLGKVGIGNVLLLAAAGALVLVLAVYLLLGVMGGAA
jgi:type VI secretion system protein ImpK